MHPGAVRDGAPRVVGAVDDVELRVSLVVIEVATRVGERGDVVPVAMDDAPRSGVGARATVDVKACDVLDEGRAHPAVGVDVSLLLDLRRDTAALEVAAADLERRWTPAQHTVQTGPASDMRQQCEA